MASSAWFVVQTHAHAESKAAAHLHRQGFMTYLPRYLKRRRHARRTETVAAPLFPSYLFVWIDLTSQRWRSVQSTVGVLRLVCHGEKPTPMSGSVIQSLKSREDEKGFIPLVSRRKFSADERVRILDGAFSGCAAGFEAMNDSERVSVLLDLLGRKVRVLLSAEFVVSA